MPGMSAIKCNINPGLMQAKAGACRGRSGYVASASPCFYVSSPMSFADPEAAGKIASAPTMAETSPLLSIGLAVYNADRYLEETLESFLAQTFTDFELIISDNASTDRTEAICRGFASRDARIKYFRNPANLGAAPNFNRTFHLSKGRYFKFAAYDDLHAPEYLDRCIRLLDADPGAVLSHSKMIDIDAAGKPIRELDDELHTGSPSPSRRFRYLVCVNHSCVHVFGVIRREALAGTPLIGGYVGSDRVLLAELGMKGRFLEVPEPLFFHREHPERSTRAYPDMRRRTQWFDSSKANVIALPAFRLLQEYLRAIGRSDLGLPDRALCYLQLIRWLKRNGSNLRQDGQYWLRHRFFPARPGRP